MIPPRLNGRTFRAMSNSTHGQSGPATEMQFTADDDYVTAIYAGGGVRLGQVLGRRTDDDALDMHYHAGSTSGEIRAGHGRATFAADRRARCGCSSSGSGSPAITPPAIPSGPRCGPAPTSRCD